MKTPDSGLPSGPERRTFTSRQEAAMVLGRMVARQLARAIADRGRALLVVSGGRTPAAFFRNLSSQDLDWSRVDVVPADERWVLIDSDKRNSGLIRRTLLQGPAAQARFHELAELVDDPQAAADEACDRLATLPWPADVVVLGMGEDGHTASLFPDAPELPQALADDADPVAVMTPASQDTVRLSLTAPRLAGASLTVLLIEGEGKQQALAAALAEPEAIPEMPVRYFFRQPLQVFWSP